MAGASTASLASVVSPGNCEVVGDKARASMVMGLGVRKDMSNL